MAVATKTPKASTEATKKPAVKKASVKKAVKPVVESDVFAIIKTGGKQYIVTPGMSLNVERIVAEKGAEISLNEVLLVSKDGNTTIGTPLVKGASVTATVEGESRDRKVSIVKFKSKTRYHKRQGHRQTKTKLTILDIK